MARFPRVLLSVIAALACLCGIASAALRPTEVPTFVLRARVVSVDGVAPEAGQRFVFRLDGSAQQGKVTGGEWCPLLSFDQDAAIKCLKLYPNLYLKRFPVVVGLRLAPFNAESIVVEAQLQWQATQGPPAADAAGAVLGREAAATGTAAWKTDVTLTGDLFGPKLGLMLWKDEAGKPVAATMATYNRRYWEHLKGVSLKPEERPKYFPIVDRFIGGDNDSIDWREGIENLARAGFSVMMLPPAARHRDILLETGLRRTSWAIYNPPGYAFDYAPNVTEESIAAWADQRAAPFLKAGYKPHDIALYAMSDEPGWYFPVMFEKLAANAAALDRFRGYLRAQGLTCQDVGAGAWDKVVPIGRSNAVDLPSKRLFYWSMRFFAWDSARHFARCTRAMEKAFYPGVPVLVNWNFFSGRFYFPGSFGNNPDKKSPDCAMGGHDWLEFGRMRGCTMLWTEDWFGDERAGQWSFYCSKLNSAARKGGVEFGGYVIPRTCGSREDGILQRILTIAGSGGKALKYFVFGPEYSFPGNCYSFKSNLLPKMAEAHAMIAAAEDVLWPGRPPRPEVAILHPRSALLWDAYGDMPDAGIVDATNAAPERRTVDYMAEVFGLYTALQHANIPVGWVEEEDVTGGWLDGIRVLYVTEPDIPKASMTALAEWVKGGGTLVTVSGAATHDRYHEEATALSETTGVRNDTRKRMLIADTRKLPKVGTVDDGDKAFGAYGVRGSADLAQLTTMATFDGGTPAVSKRKVGEGSVVHFNFMPGLSYLAPSTVKKGQLPAGFSPVLRDWIAMPVRNAEVIPPVVADRALVETPLLISDAGVAVTVLNWTGTPVEELSLSVAVPFEPRDVVAVKGGTLKFEYAQGRVTFSMPLGAADIVSVHPQRTRLGTN